MPDPDVQLDALILVPPGSLIDFAEDLGAELVRLGLRMRFRSVRLRTWRTGLGRDRAAGRGCDDAGGKDRGPTSMVMFRRRK